MKLIARRAAGRIGSAVVRSGSLLINDRFGHAVGDDAQDLRQHRDRKNAPNKHHRPSRHEEFSQSCRDRCRGRDRRERHAPPLSLRPHDPSQRLDALVSIGVAMRRRRHVEELMILPTGRSIGSKSGGRNRVTIARRTVASIPGHRPQRFRPGVRDDPLARWSPRQSDPKQVYRRLLALRYVADAHTPAQAVPSYSRRRPRAGFALAYAYSAPDEYEARSLRSAGRPVSMAKRRQRDIAWVRGHCRRGNVLHRNRGLTA